MCHKWEMEYLMRHAEELRQRMQKDEQARSKPRPAAPAAAPEKQPKELEPVPV